MASPSTTVQAPTGSMPFAPPPPLPALDNTMGAWLLGTFFGVLLQGVVLHQTYRYFRLYPKDPRYLKTWILVLLIIETVNTALSMHTCYYNLVTNYFNPVALVQTPVWSLKFLPVPGSIAAVITQMFFARRVYLIDKKFRPVAVVAALLTWAFSGCYIALTGLGWNAPNITEFLKFSWLSSLGSAMIMVADLMLTSVLIYFLRTNRTGFRRTDSLVDVLIMYTVSSGLIICIFNILNVAFALAWPNNLIYAATSIILTKLYSNSLLVSLNARQSLINRGVIMETNNLFTSTFVAKGEASMRATNNRSGARLEINHREIMGGRDRSPAALELKVLRRTADSSTDDESTLGTKGPTLHLQDAGSIV